MGASSGWETRRRRQTERGREWEESIAAAAREDERLRVRTELLEWLIGGFDPKDVGLINGRRITAEIDRICPLTLEGCLITDLRRELGKKG